QQIALLAFSQGQDGGVVGRSFRAAVPGAVVGMPVPVVFAVGLVVFVVIGNQVVQRKAVMRGNEIHAGPGFAPAPVELVAGCRDAGGKVGGRAGVALPEAAYGVPEPVVPFRPARREAAYLVAAWPAIPGLRDQFDAGQHRILPAAVEESSAFIETVGLSAED